MTVEHLVAIESLCLLESALELTDMGWVAPGPLALKAAVEAQCMLPAARLEASHLSKASEAHETAGQYLASHSLLSSHHLCHC